MKYKFLSEYMRSNRLSVSTSVYEFVPERIYETNETIDLFIKAHPKRWLKIEDEIEESNVISENDEDIDVVAFNDFIETDGDVEEYLKELHWSKVKQISQSLNIKWTKKDETIKLIVASL
jgi:hypothetical protein